MKIEATTAVLALALCAGAANAAIVDADPGGFHLQCKAQLAGDETAAWATLVRIQDWWGSDHTYSGKASNLSLKPVAGGLWSEIWDGGQVEHGRVVLAMPGQTLRVEAALGPLQQMGVATALTFTLKAPKAPATDTEIVLDYHVSGREGQDLDSLAPVIEQVMCGQFKRLDALR